MADHRRVGFQISVKEPSVKIGILGTGSVGGALGGRWAALGHEVVFGSRDHDQIKTQELLEKCSGRARATTFAASAADAEAALLAVPWGAARDTLLAAGNLAGKIVIDCT